MPAMHLELIELCDEAEDFRRDRHCGSLEHDTQEYTHSHPLRQSVNSPIFTHLGATKEALAEFGRRGWRRTVHGHRAGNWAATDRTSPSDRYAGDAQAASFGRTS